MDNATSKTRRIARTIKDSNPRRGLSRKILKEKSRLTTITVYTAAPKADAAFLPYDIYIDLLFLLDFTPSKPLKSTRNQKKL